MRKLLVILALLLFSCTKDSGNCEAKVNEIIIRYHTLIIHEMENDNSKGQIKIYEDQRRKELAMVCR